MQETTQYLCGNIQGCVLGYTQSDEITLVLVDYKKLTSSAWFDYEVQKMCSIAASMATMAFGKFFISNVKEFGYNNGEQFDMSSNEGQQKVSYYKYIGLPSTKVQCLMRAVLAFQKKKWLIVYTGGN